MHRYLLYIDLKKLLTNKKEIKNIESDLLLLANTSHDRTSERTESSLRLRMISNHLKKSRYIVLQMFCFFFSFKNQRKISWIRNL